MDPQIVMAVCAVVALVLSLAGWFYQLGRSDARLSRNEKDVAELKATLAQRDQTQKEYERDLRADLKESFGKVYAKLDALPCHNIGWKREDCQ
jgi:Tfp pilus assembly protein PilO